MHQAFSCIFIGAVIGALIAGVTIALMHLRERREKAERDRRDAARWADDEESS